MQYVCVCTQINFITLSNSSSELEIALYEVALNKRCEKLELFVFVSRE